MAMQALLSNVPVLICDFQDLCAEPDELRNYLLKTGILSDYGGTCEACREGTVRLNRDGDLFVWRCGKTGCR